MSRPKRDPIDVIVERFCDMDPAERAYILKYLADWDRHLRMLEAKQSAEPAAEENVNASVT